MDNAQPKQPKISYHTPRSAPQGELQWLEISFTASGLGTVKAFREKVAHETGRRVSLAQALDVLVKSHPFAARSGS